MVLKPPCDSWLQESRWLRRFETLSKHPPIGLHQNSLFSVQATGNSFSREHWCGGLRCSRSGWCWPPATLWHRTPIAVISYGTHDPTHFPGTTPSDVLANILVSWKLAESLICFMITLHGVHLLIVSHNPVARAKILVPSEVICRFFWLISFWHCLHIITIYMFVFKENPHRFPVPSSLDGPLRISPFFLLAHPAAAPPMSLLEASHSVWKFQVWWKSQPQLSFVCKFCSLLFRLCMRCHITTREADVLSSLTFLKL